MQAIIIGMDNLEANNIVNFNYLEKDFEKRRPVILFVGTGINSPSYIIDSNDKKNFSWDALLNHLLSHSIQMILPYNENTIDIRNALIGKGEASQENAQLNNQVNQLFSRMTKSTIVKQTLKNPSYVNLIQDFLYKQCSKEDLKNACNEYVSSGKKKCLFYSLFRLADMILHFKNIKAVVTQNYDDFLEDAIDLLSKRYKLDGSRYIKRKPRVVCDWIRDNDFSIDSFNIYHVHGFIPRYDKIQAPKNNSIVLSLDEFFEDSRNVYSWQISSQLHFLFQYTCIFCGLSLEDYTSQRLLHYVKSKHKGNLFYITANNNTSREFLILNNIKNRFYTNNGLTVINCNQGFYHIYKLLGELQYGTKQ